MKKHNLLALLLSTALLTSSILCGCETPSDETVTPQESSESKETETEAPDTSAAARLDITAYHGMTADVPYRLEFASNGDGTCIVNRVDVNILYEKPFTLSIPEKSPEGDTVIGMNTNSLSCLPQYLLPEDYDRLCQAVGAVIKDGAEGFYMKKFQAYYVHMSRANCKSDSEWAAQVEKFPALAVGDIYLLDPTATPIELAKEAAVMYGVQGCDPVALYDMARNVQKQIDKLEHPESVPSVEAAFNAGGQYIEAIEWPATVRILDSACLGGCTSLQELSLPSAVESLASDCIINAVSLKRITLSRPVNIQPNAENYYAVSTVLQAFRMCLTGAPALEELELRMTAAELYAWIMELSADEAPAMTDALISDLETRLSGVFSECIQATAHEQLTVRCSDHVFTLKK